MKNNINREKIINYYLEDDIESMHCMSYSIINNFLKENVYIMEEIIICGSWRVYNYLLTICSDTIKETTNIYECMINILELEDIEDATSYIRLLFEYKIITENEFYHYLYLYLDQENPKFSKNIGTLLYELELEPYLFEDYIYEIMNIKEQAILKMFKKNSKRQYEKGLMKMILTY